MIMSPIFIVRFELTHLGSNQDSVLVKDSTNVQQCFVVLFVFREEASCGQAFGWRFCVEVSVVFH